MNKKSKILMMGLLITIFCLNISAVYAITWQGHEWSVDAGAAESLPDDYLKLYATGALDDLFIAKLTRIDPVVSDPQSLELTLSTPFPEGGDGNSVDFSTKTEFYVSDLTNKKSIWITLDLDKFSLRAINRDDGETNKFVDAPSDIWATTGYSNKLILGVWDEADGGYIDIIFNGVKLFTILDSSFAYEKDASGNVIHSVLEGDSYIQVYTDIYAEYSIVEVFDEVTSFVPTLNPPVLSLDTTVPTPETQPFILSGSISDADTLEEWNATVVWGDGSPEQIIPLVLGLFSISHPYPNDGTYEGTITINDNGGAEPDELEFTAVIIEGSPSISITLNPPTGLKDGLPALFSGSVVATGPITGIVFDFGDGTVSDGIYSTETFEGTHIFSESGTYSVTVTVSAEGVSATESHDVFISSEPISVQFKQSAITITEGSTQTFDLNLVDLNIYSSDSVYTWTVPNQDGVMESVTGESFSYTLLQDGEYSVKLTVEEYGVKVSATMSLIVLNIDPDVTLGDDVYLISVDVPVTFTSTIFDAGEDIEEITLEIRDSDGLLVVKYPTPADSDRYLYADPSYHEIVFYEHSFSEIGVYSVVSYATDNQGTHASETKTVTVIEETLSLESISADPSIIGEGQEVYFNSRIDGTDLGLTYTAYWYDDDPAQNPNLEPVDTPKVIEVGDEFGFSTSYPQDGSFMLFLVVEGEDGTILTQNRPVEIDNLPPEVSIDDVPLIESPGLVVITGRFTDVEDHPFNYEWQVNGIIEDEGVIRSEYSVELEYDFTSDGNYLVELWITDDAGDTEHASTIVTVLINNPPVIDEATYSPEDITQGDRVDFDVIAGDPDGDEIFYLWDFGGGDTDDEQSPFRVYNTPGTKTVTITVTDTKGAYDTEPLRFFVAPKFANPQGLKNQARQMIEAAIGTYGNIEVEAQIKKGKKHESSVDVEKGLTDIINYIDKSLDERYWIDPLHVDPTKGDKVFNYEKGAVVKAQALAKKVSGIPDLEGLDDILYDVIDLLVDADRILAEVVLLEAETVTPDVRRYENYLESARRHYEKGVQYQENDKPVSAINSFRTSWGFSQKILDKYPYPQ